MCEKTKKNAPLKTFKVKMVLVNQIHKTTSLIKSYWGFFILFWAILLGLDLSNYFMHLQIGGGEESARTIEIVYQLILVFFTVCFFHGLNLIALKEKKSFMKIFGESILLTPGFILQSIFFAIAVVLGSALLILPGVYVLFTFYIAPVLAVIYPDYKGRVFMLARELSLTRIKATVAVVLFTAIVPLIPDGLIWLSSGSLKSPATPFIAPFDGALFLFCETVVFTFVYELVSEHRKQTT
jgi:hypothetical protein